MEFFVRQERRSESARPDAPSDGRKLTVGHGHHELGPVGTPTLSAHIVSGVQPNSIGVLQPVRPHESLPDPRSGSSSFSTPQEAIAYWEGRLQQLDEAREKVLQQIALWKRRSAGTIASADTEIPSEAYQPPGIHHAATIPVVLPGTDSSFCEPIDGVLADGPTLFALCESPALDPFQSLHVTSLSAVSTTPEPCGRPSSVKHQYSSLRIEPPDDGRSLPPPQCSDSPGLGTDGQSELGDLWIAPKTDVSEECSSAVSLSPKGGVSLSSKPQPSLLSPASQPQSSWSGTSSQRAPDDCLLKSPVCVLQGPVRLCL
jgi:hypothetical protein